jgi:hypothetical protein
MCRDSEQGRQNIPIVGLGVAVVPSCPQLPIRDAYGEFRQLLINETPFPFLLGMEV